MSNVFTGRSGLFSPGGGSGPASAVSIVPGTGEIDTGLFGGFGWLENYLNSSIDFYGGGAWTYSGISHGGRTAKSPITETVPDFTGSLDAVQINAGTLATHGLYQGAVGSPATANTTWTARVWLKVPSGSGTIQIRLDSGNITGTPVNCNLTTSWQSFTVTQSFDGTSTGTVRFWIINGTTTINAWMAQLVKGTKVGIIFPTGADTSGIAGVKGGHYGWVLGAAPDKGSESTAGSIRIFHCGYFSTPALQVMNFGNNYYQHILSVYGSGYGNVGSISTYYGGLSIASTVSSSISGQAGYGEFGNNTGHLLYRNNSFPAGSNLILSNESAVTGNFLECYNQALSTNVTYVTKDGVLGFDKTLAGSPGNVTINKPSGSAIIGAGTSSVVVTNSLVDANTHIVATVQTNDSTLKTVTVVPAAGSFTITGNANATANTTIRWTIIK